MSSSSCCPREPSSPALTSPSCRGSGPGPFIVRPSRVLASFSDGRLDLMDPSAGLEAEMMPSPSRGVTSSFADRALTRGGTGRVRGGVSRLEGSGRGPRVAARGPGWKGSGEPGRPTLRAQLGAFFLLLASCFLLPASAPADPLVHPHLWFVATSLGVHQILRRTCCQLELIDPGPRTRTERDDMSTLVLHPQSSSPLPPAPSGQASPGHGRSPQSRRAVIALRSRMSSPDGVPGSSPRTRSNRLGGRAGRDPSAG